MDFLKQYISPDTIDEIMEYWDEGIIFDITCNQDNTLKIIEFFNKIEIKVIDELLKRRLDIFLLPYEKIENTFSKYNIKTLVSIINEDIANIDVF